MSEQRKENQKPERKPEKKPERKPERRLERKPGKKPGRKPSAEKKWKPGDPLTRSDEVMLAVFLQKVKQLGYTPTQKQVPNAQALKRRFGNWKKVTQAAGVPWVNDKEQSLKRMEEAEWKKIWEGTFPQ